MADTEIASVSTVLSVVGAAESTAQLLAYRDAVKAIGNSNVAVKIDTAAIPSATAQLNALVASAETAKTRAGALNIKVATEGAESTIAQLEALNVASQQVRADGGRVNIVVAATGGAKTEDELQAIAATASELAGPKGKITINLATVGAAETEAQILAIEAAAADLKGQNIAFNIDNTGAKEAAAAAKAEAVARREAAAAVKEQQVQEAALAKTQTEEAAASKAQALQQQNAALKALDGNAKGATASLLGMSGTTVGVLAVGAALAVSAKEAANFQQTMQNLQAVLHAPAGDLANLGTSIQANSRDTVFTANQIAEADRQLAKAGQDANQIIAEQRDVLNLASAAQATATEGATAYVTALKDFNLTSANSKTISDDLAKAVDSSVGNLNDMQDALKQVGPVAQQAGLDLKTTTVAIADLQNAGLSGDSGTALKIFLQRLESPTKAAKAAMDDLGLSVYDTTGKLLPLAAIFDQLQQKTRGLDDETKNLDLTKIFGARGVRVADIASSQGSSGLQDIIDHENQIGSASDIAATKLNTLSGEMHQLASSANVVAVNVGSALTPSLREAANAGTELFNALGKATAALNPQTGITDAKKKYQQALTISDSPTEDLARQQKYIDDLKAQRQKALDDAGYQTSRPGFLGTGLFKRSSTDTSALDQLIAEEQAKYDRAKKTVDGLKDLAQSTLTQDIGAIINDQQSRDARSAGTPNEIALIGQHAQDAKAYVDSFKDAFLSSGNTIQQWQEIEANAFTDIDNHARDTKDALERAAVELVQHNQDLEDQRKSLLNRGAPEALVNRALFGEDFGLTKQQIADNEKALKDWETTNKAAATSAADSIKVTNQAFDQTNKALDSIKQNKGIDGLLASLTSLHDAQANLADLGMGNKALDDLVAMGDAFKSLTDQEAAASSQFDAFMAVTAHTQTYITKIDQTKAHYAELESYIKDKPLSARTDADIQFLDKYNQRLATLNNEEDKLKERQVVDANSASSVVPNLSLADQNYRDTLASYGGEVGVKVRLDFDVQAATEAASKADYLISQITDHPKTIELALSGDQAAEEALKRIEAGESDAQAKKDIVIVAKATGLNDLQTLADLIARINDKHVSIVATVATSGGVTVPVGTTGTTIGPYAAGGDVSGDLAVVGDSPGGGINRTTEVVDFRNKRVYSNAQATKMGLFGSSMPHYDGGTIDANDPNNVVNQGGPYTAQNPGPAGDLSGKGATSSAAVSNLKAVAAAAVETKTALIDVGNAANVFAGYLATLSPDNLKAVTTEFDHQFALLSKINAAKLDPKATQAEKDAAVNSAMTQSLDVAIAFSRALSDAENPANDLSADFQKIRDTGTPIAENLIRQASIMREVGIYAQKIKDDQQAIADLDAAHTAALATRQAEDTAASRAKTEAGWDAQIQQQAVSNAQALTQYKWTLETNRLDDAKAREQRNYEDAATAETRSHTLKMDNLTDQLAAAEKLQKTADSGNSALEQSLSYQAKGPGDLGTKFQAAEQLAIQKDFDSRNRQTLSDQIAAIKDSQVAENRLYATDTYNRDQLHTQATRNFADESTAATRLHATIQEQWAAESSQRQAIAFAQQVADTRHQWQIEDARKAEDTTYEASKAAAEKQLKSDQDHKTALDNQLVQAQSIEVLWEKVYDRAGDTANALLTAFAQITGQSASSAPSGPAPIRKLGQSIPAGNYGIARGA